MSNPKSKSVKKGKAHVFRDARLNEDFSIQVRDDRFILTDASDEVGDEWVDVDMAMPDQSKTTARWSYIILDSLII